MTTKFIIDTDVTIDMLRGEPQAIAIFKELSETLGFSAITVAEIYAGIANKKEESMVEQMFASFPVIATTVEIARIAGRFSQRFRSSHALEMPDAIIAASCITYDASLLTLNTKHYPMFPGLKPPYKKSNP